VTIRTHARDHVCGRNRLQTPADHGAAASGVDTDQGAWSSLPGMTVHDASRRQPERLLRTASVQYASCASARSSVRCTHESDMFFFLLRHKGVYIWRAALFPLWRHTPMRMWSVSWHRPKCGQASRRGFFPLSRPNTPAPEPAACGPLRTGRAHRSSARCGWRPHISDYGRARITIFSAGSRGSLHFAALQRAIQRLVDRHEALRTVILRKGDCQHILPRVEVRVLSRTASLFFAAKWTERPRWRIGWQRNPSLLRPERGTAVARQVIEVTDAHPLLVLNTHHIVADGWSSACTPGAEQSVLGDCVGFGARAAARSTVL